MSAWFLDSELSILIVVVTAAVCEYPEVKDDVIVSGKNFAYASEGIRLKCASSQARLTRRNTRSKCLADLSWSVKNFTCSSKKNALYLHMYVYSFDIHVHFTYVTSQSIWTVKSLFLQFTYACKYIHIISHSYLLSANQYHPFLNQACTAKGPTHLVS